MGYHLRGVTTTIFLVTRVIFSEILIKGKKNKFHLVGNSSYLSLH